MGVEVVEGGVGRRQQLDAEALVERSGPEVVLGRGGRRGGRTRRRRCSAPRGSVDAEDLRERVVEPELRGRGAEEVVVRGEGAPECRARRPPRRRRRGDERPAPRGGRLGCRASGAGSDRGSRARRRGRRSACRRPAARHRRDRGGSRSAASGCARRGRGPDRRTPGSGGRRRSGSSIRRDIGSHDDPRRWQVTSAPEAEAAPGPGQPAVVGPVSTSVGDRRWDSSVFSLVARAMLGAARATSFGSSSPWSLVAIASVGRERRHRDRGVGLRRRSRACPAASSRCGTASTSSLRSSRRRCSSPPSSPAGLASWRPRSSRSGRRGSRASPCPRWSTFPTSFVDAGVASRPHARLPGRAARRGRRRRCGPPGPT